MSFEHKPNRGSIFRNERRETDSQPTHKGDGKVVCPECGVTFDVWISAWVNELKNKTGKYFSLAFDKKDAPQPVEPPKEEDLDDDIPF
jgi:hypothetical protein